MAGMESTYMPNLRSLKLYTQVTYLVWVISFFTAVPIFIAAILDYIKKDDARGTWLESHYRWQIRTFWFAILWYIVGGITIPILIGFGILALTHLWMLYRSVKGWLRLNEGRPMYDGG